MILSQFKFLKRKKREVKKKEEKGQRTKRSIQPYTYIFNQNYFFNTAQSGKRTVTRNGL